MYMVAQCISEIFKYMYEMVYTIQKKLGVKNICAYKYKLRS